MSNDVKEEILDFLNEIEINQTSSQKKRETIKKKDNKKTFSYEQNLFVEQLQRKIDKLNIRINILRFKYSTYKNWFDNLSIVIILISSVLTFLEAIRAELNLSNTFFQITPIICSSLIALIATFTKFKKYQEKMERMARCLDKCITITFRLKRLQEHVHNCKNIKELDNIKDKFFGEPYENYINSREDIEKNLKYQELVLHMEKYREFALRFQDAESHYRYEKQKIDNKANNINYMLRNSIDYKLEGHQKTLHDYCVDCFNYIFCQNKKGKKSDINIYSDQESMSESSSDSENEDGDGDGDGKIDEESDDSVIEIVNEV